MTEFAAVIPPEWTDGRTPREVSPMGSYTVTARGGSPAALTGILLDNGSNIYVLAHPGGQRCVRTSPDTDWAVEERFDGERWPELDDLWRGVLKAVIDGGHEADAEMARRAS
jgi:hypothetical protein